MFDSRHGYSVKTAGPYVKRPGRQADRSPRSCANIKSEWSHASASLRACIVCILPRLLTSTLVTHCCRSTSNNCGLPACLYCTCGSAVHFTLCVFTNSNRLTQHLLITIHNQLRVSTLFNQQQAVFSCKRRWNATASVRSLQMRSPLLSHHIALWY